MTISRIFMGAACLALAACSSRGGDNGDDSTYLPDRTPGVADVDDAPLESTNTSATPPAAPPSETKAPPSDAPSAPPTAPQTPAVPSGSDPAVPSLVLPADCAGHMEHEPNDQNAELLPPRICGYASSGDADRFTFDVHDGNAFVLQLDGPSAAPWGEVRGTCIPERRLSVGERMRLEPSKSCTIHVNVFSSTPAAYVLQRDK